MDLPMPQDRYEVPHLHLRLDRLNRDDLADLWRVIEVEREHLERWQPPLPSSEAELLAAFEQAERGWDSLYQFRFVLRRARRLVGMCGFTDVRLDPGIGELDVWLARHAIGEGLGSQAVRVLVGAAFRELQLQRVELRPAIDNLPARRLAERVGFTLEGVRRRGIRLASGELADQALYGILSSDPRPH